MAQHCPIRGGATEGRAGGTADDEEANSSAALHDRPRISKDVEKIKAVLSNLLRVLPRAIGAYVAGRREAFMAQYKQAEKKTVVLETTRGGLRLNDNLFDVYKEVKDLVGLDETGNGSLPALTNKMIYMQLQHMPGSGVDSSWIAQRNTQVLKNRREMEEYNQVKKKKRPTPAANQPSMRSFITPASIE